MYNPDHAIPLGSHRQTSYHPQSTEMEVEPSQHFTSNYQAPQHYVREPAPFATGNTPAARAALVGQAFGSSAQMPPGGWPSPTPPSPYDPYNPPFSGLRTPPPVELSELGILKEMCLELAYHSALQFAIVYKTEKRNPTHPDGGKKFREVMKELYEMIKWCYNANILEDGNYYITRENKHILELAFKWVEMYNVNLVNLENLENPRWTDEEIIDQADGALAWSPHSDEVLEGVVAHLQFFPLLEKKFVEFKNATNRRNLRQKYSLSAAAFSLGGRGVRHKPKRHYKLTRRHKPKRHYKLTQRHKPKRHYKLTRRHKP
jgi:hypothetical protein